MKTKGWIMGPRPGKAVAGMATHRCDSECAAGPTCGGCGNKLQAFYRHFTDISQPETELDQVTLVSLTRHLS